jgi:hypothetical protein
MPVAEESALVFNEFQKTLERALEVRRLPNHQGSFENSLTGYCESLTASGRRRADRPTAE